MTEYSKKSMDKNIVFGVLLGAISGFELVRLAIYGLAYGASLLFDKDVIPVAMLIGTIFAFICYFASTWVFIKFFLAYDETPKNLAWKLTVYVMGVGGPFLLIWWSLSPFD